MEITKALGARHFRFHRFRLRNDPSRMRFTNVNHHETYPVSKANVQLVQPRSCVIRHRACAGTEDQQRGARLGEVSGSEAASAYYREIELRNAIARPGITFTEAHISQNKGQ
jgi:hypothetical protein